MHRFLLAVGRSPVSPQRLSRVLCTLQSLRTFSHYEPNDLAPSPMLDASRITQLEATPDTFLEQGTPTSAFPDDDASHLEEIFDADDQMLLQMPPPETVSQSPSWRYRKPQDFLFTDFRYLESWEEIERAVESLKSDFSKHHAAAAFSRMRFIPQPTDKRFFHSLAEKTMPLIQQMGPHHLLLIFYSAIRLDVDCHEFLDQISRRVIQMEYPFTAATSLLTNALFSVSLTRKRMGHSIVPIARNAWLFPSEHQFTAYLMTILRREGRISKFTELDCCRVIYTFAHCQYLAEKDDPLLKTICDRLARPEWITRLNELSSMLLLSSLTTLRVQHPVTGTLLRAMTKNRTLAMYQTSELVTVIYCLGVMQHWNQDAVLFILKELLKPERMDTVAEQGLSNLLYGLGKLEETKKLDKERYLLPFFREASEQERVRRYINLALTGILYSAGLLEFPSGKHSALLSPLLDELLTPERLESTATQGLVTSLWGLAKVGFRDEQRFQKLLLECIRPERKKSLTFHGIGLVLYACGLLKYRNGEILQPFVQSVTRENDLATSNDLNLIHMTYGIGRTSCISLEAAMPLIKECSKRERLKQSSTVLLCNLLHMITCLGNKSLPVLKEIVREVAIPERLSVMEPVGLQECLLATNRCPSLMRLPETKRIVHRALEADSLEKSSATHLSSFATVISMHRDFLKINMEMVERLATEVTRPHHLQSFNPIDLTNVYSTLLRLGVQDGTKLLQLLNALDAKPLSENRRFRQFFNALALTNAIKDVPLRSTLLDKLTDHISQEGCMTLYSPSDAFSIFRILLFAPPNEEAQSKWTTAICAFAEKAQTGDLSEIPTRHILGCIHDLRRHGKHLFARTEVKKLMLDALTDRKRLQAATVATLLVLIGEVVRFVGASKQEKGEGIKVLLSTINHIYGLSILPTHQTARLMALSKEFALESEAIELQTASQQIDQPSALAYRLARDLERKIGVLDD